MNIRNPSQFFRISFVCPPITYRTKSLGKNCERIIRCLQISVCKHNGAYVYFEYKSKRK